MCEYVIWAIDEGKRLRVGATRADHSPLPRGAEIITKVHDVDRDMMIDWIRIRVKIGWTLERIKQACG